MATIPSPYLLVDDMANSVLSNTSQPNSQQTFTPARVVQMLDEEQKVTITNLVDSCREDYWLQYFDTVIAASVTTYTIPQRSVMATLDDVVLVTTAGVELELPHLDQQQKKQGPFYVYSPMTYNRGIYFRDDTINIWPLSLQLPVGYTLRMKYLRRPNALTLSTNCAQITGITGNLVTCAAVPSAWAASGLVVDIINNVPQFTSIQDSMQLTSGDISGFDITLPSVPAGLSIGQWICPTGATCVPQIPVEAYPLLTNLGSLRVYMAQQNANGFQVTSKIVESMAADVREMLTPRWKGETKKIVNQNVLGRWNFGMGVGFNGW